MTIDEFLAQRSEMPDAGQWTELVHGMPCTLEPPDFLHGAAVLNLSKALGEFLQATPRGYAVFDLGVVVARDPDTIRFPAVAFFDQGKLFAQADQEVTHSAPSWVVEVISSPDRRQGLTTRVEQYFSGGVQLIWVLETRQKELWHWRPGGRAETLLAGDVARAEPVLDRFQVAVADLFREPAW
jgi:Uma2 family endonuclease